ncbi:CIC11C00000000660 [Sungouiella intermedia]|uniref:CIC11C00000000660 n=1 Tax=Sungouiella intermedia TaxID=45354 RepID=A0A1L0BRR9_9ASCO|nr:CIC11C00000000660 [[Candida] intermedia]
MNLCLELLVCNAAATSSIKVFGSSNFASSSLMSFCKLSMFTGDSLAEEVCNSTVILLNGVSGFD